MRCSGRWRRTASAAPHSAARRAGWEPSTLTVRGALHRFLDGGFEALADAPRPGRPPRWKREDLDALEDMLDASAAEGRICTTWTSAGSRRPCPATPGPAPGHGWW
ncbi:helix-turn-helix domain-containing protein [Streptomyces sp. NPDC048696]|uniref:helix-turn-helix domain-containing protein n=1 Tax=Streptomyces sp. NPDC048696 TaxID=3365585 RepID=UPI0037134459